MSSDEDLEIYDYETPLLEVIDYVQQLKLNCDIKNRICDQLKDILDNLLIQSEKDNAYIDDIVEICQQNKDKVNELQQQYNKLIKNNLGHHSLIKHSFDYL